VGFGIAGRLQADDLQRLMIEVVLLAGGRGTRLAPYTTVLPKPLMPIGDMPVLEVLLRRLASSGFTRVHLATGHLAELIEAFFGDGSRFGVELSYWREDEPLGTAGPLAHIPFSGDRVLVMNGDLLTTLDFRELVDTHQRFGSAATIAVLRREVPIDFGVVRLDADRVVGFDEKPVLTYDVSMGVYVFERAVIEYVPTGIRYDFPELLLKLLDRGLPVCAYRSDDFWVDIGRPEDYELANQRFEELRGALLGET
jgi:NDP-sugar pyrophosphorylase family protein